MLLDCRAKEGQKSLNLGVCALHFKPTALKAEKWFHSTDTQRPLSVSMAPASAFTETGMTVDIASALPPDNLGSSGRRFHAPLDSSCSQSPVICGNPSWGQHEGLPSQGNRSLLFQLLTQNLCSTESFIRHAHKYQNEQREVPPYSCHSLINVLMNTVITERQRMLRQPIHG